jgi:hypothetical protein
VFIMTYCNLYSLVISFIKPKFSPSAENFRYNSKPPSVSVETRNAFIAVSCVSSVERQVRENKPKNKYSLSL